VSAPEPLSEQRRAEIERYRESARGSAAVTGVIYRMHVGGLLAEVDRLRAITEQPPPTDAIRFLVDISTSERSHTYADGLCPDGAPYPDEEGRASFDRRDEECPACAATDVVIAWLADPVRLPEPEKDGE
jgi:hypothetical protein